MTIRQKGKNRKREWGHPTRVRSAIRLLPFPDNGVWFTANEGTWPAIARPFLVRSRTDPATHCVRHIDRRMIPASSNKDRWT